MRITHSFFPSEEDINYINLNSDNATLFSSNFYINLLKKMGREGVRLCLYADGLPSLLMLANRLFKRLNFYWLTSFGDSFQSMPLIIRGLDDNLKKNLQEQLFNIIKKEKLSNLAITNVFYSPSDLRILSDKLIEAEYRKIDLDIARLDLRKGEEFLWRNLRVNFRNAVRQAKKNNLFVYRGSSKDLFEMFLKLFKKKPIGKKILLRNDFLRKEFREFSRERLVEFWVAEKDNVVVAVNYFLRHKDSVYWLHNVYLKEAMIYRANNLVLWEALKYYSNNGFNLAHLGTLGYENNGPSGYGRFKLGLNPLLERVAYFNRINNRFMGKIGDAHLRFRKLINNFIRHKI